MTPLCWQNLCIRPAVPEDAPLLARWWNDGAVMAHAGFPKGLGRSAEQIAADLATDADERRRRMILELDGAPLGECSFFVAGVEAEIGIKLCEACFQNRGHGRCYLSMLIDHLFRDRGMRRIRLDTDPANARARHVYESLGFRLTGIRTACWTDQLGAKRDAADYELLPGDFRDFRLTLTPLDRALLHEYYRGFVMDPALFEDPADMPDYVYDPAGVDACYDRLTGDPSRVDFLILLGERPIGEIALKHLDRTAGSGVLSIHLQSDAVKDRGYGTRAERLLLTHAFETLGLRTVLADALASNLRSRHVLEKLGFSETGRRPPFVDYRLDREAWTAMNSCP